MENPADGLNGNEITTENVERGNENGEKEIAIKEWDGMGMRERLNTLMKEKNNDSIMEYDIETGREHGVWKKEEKCYAIKRSDEENRVVVVDLKTHEMRVYDGDDWKENKQDGVDCIDLDVSGKRWEGGVKDGKPFGYGVLFDEEGKKEYEGFMVDGVKMGYGIEYYNDIERIEYEGCFCEGKRFGRGVLYDRNGLVDNDGLWKNDEPCLNHFDGKVIDSYSESIVIPDNSFTNVDSFIFHSFFYSLAHIVIEDGCFGMVRVFELDGLSELESVVIGQHSFMIGGDERNDGSCRIVNCPKLKSIQIEYESFYDYHSFELNNLPSLQSIEIGDDCFGMVRVFELNGLGELESVVIGQHSFMIGGNERNDGDYRIVNCPKLKSIQIEYESFYDYHSFELSNLPSLQSIDIGYRCFYYAPSLSLTG